MKILSHGAPEPDKDTLWRSQGHILKHFPDEGWGHTCGFDWESLGPWWFPMYELHLGGLNYGEGEPDRDTEWIDRADGLWYFDDGWRLKGFEWIPYQWSQISWLCFPMAQVMGDS